MTVGEDGRISRNEDLEQKLETPTKVKTVDICPGKDIGNRTLGQVNQSPVTVKMLDEN